MMKLLPEKIQLNGISYNTFGSDQPHYFFCYEVNLKQCAWIFGRMNSFVECGVHTILENSLTPCKNEINSHLKGGDKICLIM
jgi:hypothetical protein